MIVPYFLEAFRPIDRSLVPQEIPGLVVPDVPFRPFCLGWLSFTSAAVDVDALVEAMGEAGMEGRVEGRQDAACDSGQMLLRQRPQVLEVSASAVMEKDYARALWNVKFIVACLEQMASARLTRLDL